MTYDCFISFASKWKGLAEDAATKAKAAGLVSFLAPRDLAPGDPWPARIGNTLSASRDLLLLWSEEARDSPHVTNEINLFAARGAGKIFVVNPDNLDPPDVLAHLQTVESVEDAIYALVGDRATRLNSDVERLTRELEETETIIADQLEQFLYKKIWKGFFDSKVHIFTCGRDVPPALGRGHGGRTGIDMWDYQTVCDIHSFFARQNPQTLLEIVPPASKANPSPDDHFVVGQMLQNKDCIIIGSPDVSDYAEFVWARLHGIRPWVNAKEKRSGFVIQKQAGAASPSAIYWQVDDEDQEGVALIRDDGTTELFRPETHDGSLTTHGILVLAHNPCDAPADTDHRVMILSGFTGVATNAVAAFVTSADYAADLHDLDRKIDNSRDVEVLLEVTYSRGPNWQLRDDRTVTGVSVKQFAYI